jgi:hypothetical protein
MPFLRAQTMHAMAPIRAHYQQNPKQSVVHQTLHVATGVLATPGIALPA